MLQQWHGGCPAGAFRLIDTDNNTQLAALLSLMKMDLAGPGSAQALRVAVCQSQSSDIWEQLNAKGGREQDSLQSTIS